MVKLIMGKVILFIALVSLGIFGIVTFSGNSSSNPALQNLDSVQSSPTAMQYNTEAMTTPTASASPALTLTPEQKSATTASIVTTKGEIILDLYADVAPLTVENFKQKATSGFYNNLTFHRVEDWVVQGGDPLGNGTGGGNMKVEFNSKPFVVGSLGVASRGDGKVQNDAQFFITKKDASWLNGQYTNFGMVTKGMDIVEKMAIGDKIISITLK